MNHGVGLLSVMVAATNQCRYRLAAEQSLPSHPERGAADCRAQGAMGRQGRRSGPGTRSVRYSSCVLGMSLSDNVCTLRPPIASHAKNEGLEYATGTAAVIAGKPSKSFYELVLEDM
ncbi:hypothetical protein BC938DRAFT_472809 [Jimgerdemannia flammicorona]|uniref:Uncharacterized protein n=1 Tax=Jimgerdemannia flammicorona TaxID=994334 RepID=A0A433QTP8_9FUNG|nr:hypothetical protein BC938DRAFT_472809 [Jimgerdemannia flammicorona]